MQSRLDGDVFDRYCIGISSQYVIGLETIYVMSAPYFHWTRARDVREMHISRVRYPRFPYNPDHYE